MPPGKIEDWIALLFLPGLGPILARRCLERFGDPREVAYRVPHAELAEVSGLGPRAVSSISSARTDLARRVERELETARRMGLRLISLADLDYPAALAPMPDAPLVLYMKGALAEGVARIAVVGARRATAYGRRVAAGLGSALAARGVEVVSGGARGIDTCAHVGVLESEGRTIAVLGSGFRHPYPAENVALFDRIAERGALVSEFPLDVEPRPENFPRRNRIISGLSAAVVVVEATEKSGSLTTVAHALDQGREVMAVPGPVSSEQSRGCHRLIQQGAKLVQRVEDIVEELSPMYASAILSPPQGAGEEGPKLLDLTPDEVAVLALFDDSEPIQLDRLADVAPLGIARLQAALFSLEVRGAVEQMPGRYYLCRLRRET